MFQLDTDIYTKNRQMNLAEKMGSQSMAASQQEMGLNDEKIKAAKVERAAQYLSMATPENWPAIRSQAISEGLGNEQVIPQQYDPNWINQTRSAFLSASDKIPSAIQEYNFYNKLGAPEQEKFLNVKRAQQVINLGGSQIVRSPLGGVSETYEVTPKPDEDPIFKREQKRQEAIGDATGKAEGAIEKKAIQADDTLSLIAEAEQILPKASSGLLQKIGTGAVNMAGISTDGSKANRRLKVLSAALTSGVPRMEGPQSNFDVELYKQAAADVGNESVPFEDRLAALDTIKTLQNKYKQAGSLAPDEAIPPIPTTDKPRRWKRVE